MNFYKYQNKLMSICENAMMSFKCPECYQSFPTQADLRCHVHDRHQRRDPAPRPPPPPEITDVKQEEEGTAGSDADKDDGGAEDTTKPIKKESPQDEVNVKTEHQEKDDGDDEPEVDNDGGMSIENVDKDNNEDEDEEVIDVGVNNRGDEKPLRADDDADIH